MLTGSVARFSGGSRTARRRASTLCRRPNAAGRGGDPRLRGDRHGFPGHRAAGIGALPVGVLSGATSRSLRLWQLQRVARLPASNSDAEQCDGHAERHLRELRQSVRGACSSSAAWTRQRYLTVEPETRRIRRSDPGVAPCAAIPGTSPPPASPPRRRPPQSGRLRISAK